MKQPLIATGLVLALLNGGFSVMPAKAQDEQRKAVTKVMPAIPELAKQMHIAGKVKIEITIAADGHVLTTHVVGGSPLLVNAALEALKQWRFEPAPTATTDLIEFDFKEF
ncbi:MAG TPA: energy transducer TonB [Candidatus Acidoferrales bacterium]|nr:energy transducer TonB [Candidatus Acidoferrales bacterium]